MSSKASPTTEINITNKKGAIALPGSIGDIIGIERMTEVTRKNMLK
jgi:hypothetical protein